ncbi:hypothetical protein L6452_31024 [Arctium lappa]|uniref:Uncharacterized protein n=1 Tax=Arctium lappa TaxID=4217 RepID=A0ACB8ZK89_ARCLA|nr:hypothetical protein L6452_31024 [Arctium lappa]
MGSQFHHMVKERRSSNFIHTVCGAAGVFAYDGDVAKGEHCRIMPVPDNTGLSAPGCGFPTPCFPDVPSPGYPGSRLPCPPPRYLNPEKPRHPGASFPKGPTAWVPRSRMAPPFG